MKAVLPIQNKFEEKNSMIFRTRKIMNLLKQMGPVTMQWYGLVKKTRKSKVSIVHFSEREKKAQRRKAQSLDMSNSGNQPFLKSCSVLCIFAL